MNNLVQIYKIKEVASSAALCPGIGLNRPGRHRPQPIAKNIHTSFHYNKNRLSNYSLKRCHAVVDQARLYSGFIRTKSLPSDSFFKA
jgi:hypothetical protein